MLKDPEKRKKYDQLGSSWQQGDNFRPPPGWEHNFDFGSDPRQRQEKFFWSSEGGDFSDFFETLFGGGFQEGFQESRGGRPYSRQQRGSDHEAVLRIPLEEAFRGGKKTITMQGTEPSAGGGGVRSEKRYDVKIPPGILPGQKIRLSGQGGKGSGGGGSGDLFLRVEVEPHPRFRLKGRDLYTEVPIAPWEAALGANIDIQTLSGPLTLKVPPGTQSGQKLRLHAKGMPNAKGPPGDLYAIVQIKVPKSLSSREKELFKELDQASAFNPRY